MDQEDKAESKVLKSKILEALIHISFIVALLAWCFQILRPFLTPIIWGFIIAVICKPLYEGLLAFLKNRNRITATLFALLLLLLLIGPVAALGVSLIETVQQITDQLESGTLSIPKPPESVATWPLIGEKLSAFWNLASTNIDSAIDRIKPQLTELGKWLLNAGLLSILGLLQFIFSIIIAAVFLAYRNSVEASLHTFAQRIAGDFGNNLVEIANATIRSVALGVVGVAIIQSLLAGIGLLAMDISGAGLWTLLIFLLAIMQLSPLIILAPIIVYVFSTADTTPAIIFTIWSVIVSFSDAIMKPMLLGRGVDIPMPIILIGAMGGMITAGIIGLFIGAVVFSFTYKLFLVWLNQDQQAT